MKNIQIINGGQTCKTIYQTLKEHSDIDCSKVFILVRLYEVSDEEDIVQDITYATNSQNPVDFRDLKSNDSKQQLLELGARDLGFEYKRKRDNIGNTNAIPSTVAAESVLAVWRGKPHLAKYKRSEFFDKYYNEIFTDLNAAQMIIAVLIFRYCDNRRKQSSTDKDINAQRPYSQYFLSYIIGKGLLDKMEICLEQLTHNNFQQAYQIFTDSKEQLYLEAENLMVQILENYFNKGSLTEIDGRTMAAAFRRFDIMLDYLS
jgi:hypothetical protein